MKRALVALGLALSLGAAHSGTVYRDRHHYIPNGGVCMVEFKDHTINANLIKEIEIDNYDVTEWGVKKEGRVFDERGWVKTGEYQALRILMINGGWYQYKNPDKAVLETERKTLLVKIKKECQ